MYLSDRQRVESLLIPQMMWGIVKAGVDNFEAESFKRCLSHLVRAMAEPVEGLDASEKRKIILRTGRAHLQVTEPYRNNGTRVEKVALMVFFLLKSITDCEYLVIGEGSHIEEALDVFLPVIEPSAGEAPLYASACKHAAKMLDHLQRLGYFAGVPFSA
jgi:hypothetical protein